MPDIVLPGCRPEPLMAYLKALGVLRLVAEQKDSGARGCWRAGTFVLSTRLTAQELMEFLLTEYAPTPVVAPWAGGSGFFKGDNRKAVDAIAASKVERLASYREVIARVGRYLKGRKQTAKPGGEIKEELVRLYRRELPDAFIEWMDCALVLQTDGQAFPPLMGTGGNDGRLDFTQNFMQRLAEIGLCHEAIPTRTRDLLVHALFDIRVAGMASAAVGQFNPGSAGGPNATQGMEGAPSVDPWDFILMIEGALLLAGSVARRMGSSGGDRASFPFTVAVSPVGYGSASQNDSGAARGELWLPLWTTAASLRELKLLFAEGRAEVAGRQARNGVEFSRGVASLGTDRGVDAFVRYGLLKRSGKAFLATPLARVGARADVSADLLRAIDPWLGGLRRAAAGKGVPPRVPAALRRFDSAVFDFCRYGGKPRFTAILCALGGIEKELALLSGKVGGRTVQPVPQLSPEWIEACDDGSAEFRIALALASICDAGAAGPLRCNLEPVEMKHGRRGAWFAWVEGGRSVVWHSGDFHRNLVAVLERRVMEAGRANFEGAPLAGRYQADFADVVEFLEARTDDRRIEELLWGAMLIRRDARWPRPAGTPRASTPLPRAYALLKLLFMPASSALRSESDGRPVRPEPSILARLRAGDVNGACEVAARRLRASGHVPMPGPMSGGSRRAIEFGSGKIDAKRLAAALLIPIRDVRSLGRLVLRREEEEARVGR